MAGGPGTADQSTDSRDGAEIAKLSADRPTVLDMDSTPRLGVVEPARTVLHAEPAAAPGSGVDRATEDYWARVQQLRTDLARLRPAN